MGSKSGVYSSGRHSLMDNLAIVCIEHKIILFYNFYNFNIFISVETEYWIFYSVYDDTIKG